MLLSIPVTEKNADEKELTPDHLITAYTQGKKKGWDEVFDTVDKLAASNVVRATALLEDLFHQFKEVHKLDPLAIFLRLRSPSRFEAITMIPTERFISDDALTAI